MSALQCADYHISLVDRGKFEKACQLCAAAVLNDQAQLVLEVVMAFIQDRARTSKLPCLCTWACLAFCPAYLPVSTWGLLLAGHITAL